MQLLNAASARGLNGVTGREALLRSAQLISAWDTYGWVLSQEGSTSEAEPWLHAAWVDGFGAAAGAHYGKLLAKQGRGAEASRVLALAAQGERGSVDEAANDNGSVARNRAGGRALPTGAVAAGEMSFAVSRPERGAGGVALFDVDYGLSTVTVARFAGGEASLAGMADAVAKVDTHTLIPPGSVGHLVRRGVLACVAGGACRLRVLPPLAAVAQ